MFAARAPEFVLTAVVLTLRPRRASSWDFQRSSNWTSRAWKRQSSNDNRVADPSRSTASTRGGLVVRIGVISLFALVAGAVAWRAQYRIHAGGGDHLLIWRATRAVLDGNDPYQVRWSSGNWILPPVNLRFFYPLPAIAFGLPFTWLSPSAAAFWFVFSSATFLGYAITRDGFERVPVLLSVPFLGAVQFSQTSPLIVACALVPATAGLALLKPNIGLALFAWRPSWTAILVAFVLCLASLALRPDWPKEWLALLRDSPAHHAPITVAGGVLVLASLVRWRRPDARLLLAMAVIPHGLYFYDELPLFLVARSRRESMVLVVSSWVGLLGWMATSAGFELRDMASWVVWSLYVPATAMVLLRADDSGKQSDVFRRRAATQPADIHGVARVPTSAEPN